MLASLGTDTKKVRNFNRSVIVNLIRSAGPLSKSSIARRTGISFSTVNRVVDELLKEELIRLRNDLEHGSGRPGELFEFDGKSHFAIGVDVGTPNLRGMIAYLSGEIHKEITIPLEPGNGPENYSRLIALLDQLRNDSGMISPKISGVGLGVAGIVDFNEGVILHSKITGWDNFPLARRLYKDTGLTLFLDSDINLTTLGEYGFGVGQGLSNLVCLTLGTRISCGLIINGDLFRGAHFRSGRLDNFIPTSQLVENYQNRPKVTLEAIISSPSVLSRARSALHGIDPAGANGLEDAILVYRAAGKGEPWALDAICAMIPDLAIAIANIASLLDPDMVILSGRLGQEARVIIPLLTNYLNGKMPQVPHIESSSLAAKATVMGAIMLVYRGILQNW